MAAATDVIRNACWWLLNTIWTLPLCLCKCTHNSRDSSEWFFTNLVPGWLTTSDCYNRCYNCICTSDKAICHCIPVIPFMFMIYDFNIQWLWNLYLRTEEDLIDIWYQVCVYVLLDWHNTLQRFNSDIATKCWGNARGLSVCIL